MAPCAGSVPHRSWRSGADDDARQASILLIGGLCGVLVGALVLGAVARAVGREAEAQRAEVGASAEAELAPAGPDGMPPAGSGYDGPFAVRQGERMRPDVAHAFDRMERAARADGVTLLITSAYRSDAEQAVLWQRNPDPKWVAPPGKSLHRYATELDLGPKTAYAWLAAHAERFHFLQRYSHEPWH